MTDDTRPDEGPDREARCSRCRWGYNPGANYPSTGYEVLITPCPEHIYAPAPPAPAVPVTAPDDTLRREVERLCTPAHAVIFTGPFDREVAAVPVVDLRAALAARENADQGARALAQVRAVEALIEQHGDSWLYVAELRAALARDTAEPGCDQ